MNTKFLLLALISTGMASCLLFHFFCIWTFGRFYIHEPALPVLSLETMTMILILIFSIVCFIQELREKGNFKH